MTILVGPERWARVQVRELSIDRGLVGGPFGSSLGRKDYRPSGVPVIRGTNLAGASSFSPEEFVFVSEAKADELKRNLAIPGDLVLTQRGTLGQVGIVPERPFARYVISQSQMRLRCACAKAIPRFLYYVFRSPMMVEQIFSGAITTGVPHINLGILGDLELLLPPLAEQRGIATTLGALDNKIESNRRLDEICLSLAVETYRSACDESSRWLPLSQAGKWLSGGTPSTEEPAFWSGDFPWISAASMKSFHVAVSDRRLTSAGLEQATNVVPAGTVLLVVRGMSLKTELRMGVAQRPVAFGQDCKAILPTAVPSALLATALYSVRSAILELVDEAGHGTGRLQWDLLSAFPIAIPDDERLVPLLDMLLARAAAAATESRKLAELRDALLPELLSGRIRVPEASEAVDQVLA